MLSAQDNELVTRTGPGTPMGELFRRYWHPVLLSDELPENDGPPVRRSVLGEKLIAFRDSEGRVGLLEEGCPHRCMSLFYGINDGGGLMCAYHGWKFDVEGRCIDMPSDHPSSTFKDRVRAVSYPTIESAGMVWAYMGPAEHQPPPPSFIFNRLPASHVVASRVPVYCNWLQSVEGDIDSTHLGTMHVYYKDLDYTDDGSDKPGYGSPALNLFIRAKHRYARVDVQDTDYGFRLIAVRDTPKGNQHVRINCHILPEFTFIASPGRGGSMLLVVPDDDHTSTRFAIQFNPDRPFSADERMNIRNRNMQMDPANPKLRLRRADNDYLIDRRAQKETLIAGIWPIPEQDYAGTESMGKIVDRTREHLYPADAAIIRLRQQLIRAAKNLQEGIEPPGIDQAIPWEKIRSEEIIIGPDDDPWLVAADAGESRQRVLEPAGDD